MGFCQSPGVKELLGLICPSYIGCPISMLFYFSQYLLKEIISVYLLAWAVSLRIGKAPEVSPRNI